MVGTYIYAGRKVSESEFKSKVYGKDSPQARASRERDARSSSSRSSSRQPTNNQARDSVASSFYGKPYSELNQRQQLQVRGALTQAEQRLKLQGMKASPSDLIESVRSRMTEEARERTAEQTRAEIKARETAKEEQQKETQKTLIVLASHRY